jgi:pentatricopeptide repeat protein
MLSISTGFLFVGILPSTIIGFLTCITTPKNVFDNPAIYGHRLFVESSKYPKRKVKSQGVTSLPFFQKRKSKREITINYDELMRSSRWKEAERIEARVAIALEKMNDKDFDDNQMRIRFPSVRECNAAMATFGDGGNFLRALGLFLKMRKAASVAHAKRNILTPWNPPIPTLVTYSTLMSRAVAVGKERLALRLWYLMKTQPYFFTKVPKDKYTSAVIVPDVKAANILMNVHAKLCDVESAEYLLEQMIHGNGTDVPKLEPNIVTYNSLLDACRRAGDLDAALKAKRQLNESGLFPDIRTFTTLIATIGRKASSEFGAKDPSLGFTLLNEMTSLGIRPNGMTYSALIDACGRCGKTDMALKGLRIMMRQKKRDKRDLSPELRSHYTLYNEVGAWTSTIHTLGKAGRVDTALRLFQSMQSWNVQPNDITCGCLSDSLLRYGRTAETLKVLEYMKQKGIIPSEVMYTSLMSSACRMAENENKLRWKEEEEVGEIESKRQGEEEKGGEWINNLSCRTPNSDSTKAIEVYTALMKTLMEEKSIVLKTKIQDNSEINDSNIKHTRLVKVFLVFQQMKALGTKPDIACYNVLLRACAQAGDGKHAMEILKMMIAENDHRVIPNSKSFREALKASERSGRSDWAEWIWQTGLSISNLTEKNHHNHHHPRQPIQQMTMLISDSSNNTNAKMNMISVVDSWKPTSECLAILLGSYLREASNCHEFPIKRKKLYQTIILLYKDSMTGSSKRIMDKEYWIQSSRVLGIVLRAIVCLDSLHLEEQDTEQTISQTKTKRSSASSTATTLRRIAISILSFEVWKKEDIYQLDAKTSKALKHVERWKQEMLNPIESVSSIQS